MIFENGIITGPEVWVDDSFPWPKRKKKKSSNHQPETEPINEDNLYSLTQMFLKI